MEIQISINLNSEEITFIKNLKININNEVISDITDYKLFNNLISFGFFIEIETNFGFKLKRSLTDIGFLVYKKINEID